VKKIMLAVALLLVGLAVTSVAEAGHRTRKHSTTRSHKKSHRSSQGWKRNNNGRSKTGMGKKGFVPRNLNSIRGGNLQLFATPGRVLKR
jgi:hypothetical protein